MIGDAGKNVAPNLGRSVGTALVPTNRKPFASGRAPLTPSEKGIPTTGAPCTCSSGMPGAPGVPVPRISTSGVPGQEPWAERFSAVEPTRHTATKNDVVRVRSMRVLHS
jgi:hypothetical protein